MKKVLTVDDSKVVRSMVTRYLQGYGVAVIEATNGQEGVDAARQHQPDLVLLDITMPVMDGRQALAELRKDPACNAIPVIMLTAETGRDIVVEIAKLKVNGYIVKPFQKETFDQAVSKVLGAPTGEASVTVPSAAAAEKSLPVDPKTVLVVDDSDRVVEAAKAALGGSLNVVTALGGREAIERYKEARPGVVVLDLLMPDLDGFDTLNQLRLLGNSEYVALAVRGEEPLREKARKAGFHAIVDKPFQAQDLLDRVVAAASAKATPEDLLQMMLGEEGGCSVLDLPDPRTKSFGRVAPLLGKKLRALAEDGLDKLVLDVGKVVELNSDAVKMLVAVIAEAQGVGIRTAICGSAEVLAGLKQFAETQSMPSGSSRDEARQRLA